MLDILGRRGRRSSSGFDRRGRRSWGPALLAVSLGINLFFAGWMLSQGGAAPLLGGGDPYAKPEPAPDRVAEVIAAALPPADAALLRQAMAQKHDALLQARRTYLDRYEAVRAVIGAPVVDPEVLRAAIAQVRAARQAERTLFGDTIVETLPKMSYPGRQAFVATHLGARP